MVKIDKVLKNQLFKDSTWAVCGNGLGYFFILLSGIIIARLIGKDAYGEYSAMKNVILYIAGLASFGMGLTSTRYIAEIVEKNIHNIKGIIKNCFIIVLSISIALVVILQIFVTEFSQLLNFSGKEIVVRYLSILIIIRAVTIVQSGILSGLKNFKYLGISNIVTGILLLVLSYPMSIQYGLTGAFAALIIHHISFAVINSFPITLSYLKEKDSVSLFTKMIIIKDSFPLMLRGLSEYLCNFLLIHFFTRYSSIGEYAIFSIAMQWNAIVIFVPSLLSNVVLSYLATDIEQVDKSNKMFKRMLFVNFVCSIAPLAFVLIFSDYISSLYGATFSGIRIVLCVYVLSAVFSCLAQVYISDLIARNKNWFLFASNSSKDCFVLIVSLIVLSIFNNKNAAFSVSIISVLGSVIFLILLAIEHNFCKIKKIFL